MATRELTADIARELLHYDPKTGKLFWKKRDVKWFKQFSHWCSNHGKRWQIIHLPQQQCDAWNRRFANKTALKNICRGRGDCGAGAGG